MEVVSLAYKKRQLVVSLLVTLTCGDYCELAIHSSIIQRGACDSFFNYSKGSLPG